MESQNSSNILNIDSSSAITENTQNQNTQKTRKFRYTPSDLMDAEKELNVSNMMQLQNEITDDMLLYNKEDELLNSAFNKNNININDDSPDMLNENINVKSFSNNFNNNLESEEILDDKWDDIRQFMNLKDISYFSLTNKKIGKNAVLDLITELEKERNYFEEKVLSSVGNILYFFCLKNLLQLNCSIFNEIFTLNKNK